MATFELTPNIGLKNIDIGSFPWGNEERENKIILDTAIANISANGTLAISLLPNDAILKDASHCQVTNVVTSGQAAVAMPITAIGVDSIYWTIPAAMTYPYSPSRVPFVATGTFSGTAGVNFITSTDGDPVNEIQENDMVNIANDPISYTVTSVVVNGLTLDQPLTNDLSAGSKIGVNPVGGSSDRLKFMVSWVSQGQGKAAFRFSLATAAENATLPIPFATTHDSIEYPSLAINDLTVNKIIFCPTNSEIVAGQPSFLKLQRLTTSDNNVVGTINIIGIDIVLSRAKCVPAYYTTYYNISGSGSELESQDTAYTFDTNGNLTLVTEVVYGYVRTTSLTYNSDGNVSTQVVVFKGIETTDTYTYNTDLSIKDMTSVISIV